jgi:hypothetical protein
MNIAVAYPAKPPINDPMMRPVSMTPLSMTTQMAGDLSQHVAAGGFHDRPRSPESWDRPGHADGA